MGRIDQTTHSLTLRLNVHITPDLSIQYYGSPFVSSGSYIAFKKATDTLAEEYDDRFHVYASDEIAFVPEENTYDVQEAAGGPGSRYSFGNPGLQLPGVPVEPGGALGVPTGLVVLRRLVPGPHQRQRPLRRLTRHNFDALWRSAARNVFLVKLQHWFSL